MPTPGRPYLVAHLTRVQELLDQGKTHVQISVEAPVSTRTVSRWLREGLLRRPSPVSVWAAPTAAPGPAAEQELTTAPEPAPKQEWSAHALLDIGMDAALVGSVLQLVEGTTAVSNRRWREWKSGYVPLVARAPDEWAAAMAFLPILGRDLCNPALKELAELMHESVPWEDGTLRRRYGSLAKPLLSDARVEWNYLAPFRERHRHGGRGRGWPCL